MMHNLRHIDTRTYNSKDILHQVGRAMRNGRRNKNRDNYNAQEININTKFDEYSLLFDKYQLEKLSVPLNLSKEEAVSIRNLYESGKAIHDLLWSELTTLNGGRKIVCPICGETMAEELDHYVPREIYPEFSLHILNLIPTCHRCNSIKHTTWLDANKKRIIFNAYLDAPATDFIYTVTVRIINSLPYINVFLDKSKLNSTPNILEATTASAVDLYAFYEYKANEELQNNITKITDTAPLELKKYKDKDAYWSDKMQIYSIYVSNPLHYKASDVLAYKAMLDPVFGKWIKSVI